MNHIVSKTLTTLQRNYCRWCPRDELFAARRPWRQVRENLSHLHVWDPTDELHEAASAAVISVLLQAAPRVRLTRGSQHPQLSTRLLQELMWHLHNT